MIIGTAGHIDHGKTALVKALTGVDGDRLKEEKARGITIDLGFAYLPARGGQILGFIDVPGHERFVHTMLAGASGIDFAMLTVAADDGIKPQTLEHLAILDLLGISQGVAVVTKADLASDERIAQVTDQIKEAIANTAFANAEVLAVSAITGRGIDELREYLIAAASVIHARSAEGRFRLAVDRVFTLSGVGVIVTGTVLSGIVRTGDQVQLSPSGLEARVRSIHAQNRPAEFTKAGDRSALNLTGTDISKDAIHRGDVVLDPELHAPTDRIDAVLRVLSSEERPIGQWFPVRLHHAATEVGARVVLLEDKSLQPGTVANVQLVLDQPIAAGLPDRFVLRDVSAQRTIGGGKFIDLRAPSRKRRTPERHAQREALAIDDPSRSLSALLEVAPFSADLTAFARDRALSGAQMERLASSLGLTVLESRDTRTALSPLRWKAFAQSLNENVAEYHATNPDLQGIGREQLRLMLVPRLTKTAFAVALQKLSEAGDIALDGAFVRLTSHNVRLAPGDETAWITTAELLSREERFRPPRVRDIAAATGYAERDVRRLLKLAGRLGWVDEVAHDHFFLRETIREIVAIAAGVAARAESKSFNAADLRDRLDNGRKVAIQILEFLDRHGVTLRKGDLRRMNAHRLDLFGSVVLSSADVQGGEASPVGRSDFKSEWGSEPVPGGFDSHSPPPAFPKKLS
jgi:selenocysteine-specific elongation factor